MAMSYPDQRTLRCNHSG